MATVTTFKDILDLPDWRPLAVSPTADGAGRCLAGDMRNNEDRHPELFFLSSGTALCSYNAKQDGWTTVGSPSLAGTFGAGGAAVFSPRGGPKGALAGGNSTTAITLSTALPAAVGPNQLADRGDGRGFKIRIVGLAAGKTEERLIAANSAGTSPTLLFDDPFSFVPAAGDAYEILSGRVYMLGAGTSSAGIWKYYDVATGTISGNLATTGLPATISTQSSLICRDELYVPCGREPGEGFLGLVNSAGSSSTTITGMSSGGDSGVLANEFRNFQIRIVSDSVTPGAAGQRRKVATHTAGPGAIYTVPAWTVMPSSQAVFVIEETNEILLWTSASASTYCYAPEAIAGGQAADSWSTSTYAVRPAVTGAGLCSFQSFGPGALDAGKNARWSNIFSFRGSATKALDVLDVAGASAGVWSGDVPFGGGASGITFTTGSCAAYDSVSNGGRYAYLQGNGGTSFYRFNVSTRTLQSWAQLRFAPGTAVASQRLAVLPLVDGSQKLGFLYALRAAGSELFHCLLQR
jgi:hypothetical protein